MTSAVENGAPPVMLPVGLALRDLPATEVRRDWRDWIAVAAAALLHVAVIGSLIWDWRFPVSPPHEAEPIPVSIVFAPPAKPEPAPQPSPPLFDRQSGKDERTTAPPSAEETGPDSARPQRTPSPPEEKPAPPKDAAKAVPRKEAARPDPRKEADKARAPRQALEHLRRIEPGERELTGDPYLNRLWALVERHRVYPKVRGRFGLWVEGTAVYRIVVDRRGSLLRVELVRSSGTAELDLAGANMIRASAPFPPPPPEYPGLGIEVEVTLPLYPEPR